MFGRYRDGALRACGGPAALDAAAPLLSAADFAVVNLETGLCEEVAEPWARTAENVLVGPPQAVDWLAGWGIDAVSLANNHAMDCGPTALANTVEALREAGVAPLGIGEPFRGQLIEVDGVRLAVIAATDRWNADRPTSPSLSAASGEVLEARLEEAIARAHDDAADIVLVVLHWGTEITPRPVQSQRELARGLVAAGADLVIGHGPHVLQEIEPFREGLIAYSLGNLLFDRTALHTRETGILEARLEWAQTGWRVAEHALTPFLIEDCALRAR